MSAPSQASLATAKKRMALACAMPETKAPAQARATAELVLHRGRGLISRPSGQHRLPLPPSVTGADQGRGGSSATVIARRTRDGSLLENWTTPADQQSLAAGLSRPSASYMGHEQNETGEERGRCDRAVGAPRCAATHVRSPATRPKPRTLFTMRWCALTRAARRSAPAPTFAHQRGARIGWWC